MSSVGVGCHTAQYLTYQLLPPVLTTYSLVREAFQGCWRPASGASGRPPAPASWLRRPLSVDSRSWFSQFICCLDETINKSLLTLEVEGVLPLFESPSFFPGIHLIHPRDSPFAFSHTAPLLPLTSDVSGSVTRQPIKCYTVWQPLKSQKVTTTLLFSPFFQNINMYTLYFIFYKQI